MDWNRCPILPERQRSLSEQAHHNTEMADLAHLWLALVLRKNKQSVR